MRNIPINDRRNRAVGVAFPLEPTDTSFFKLNYTTADQIKDNLRLFLLTGEYDRMMLSVRGINLYQFLFENNFDADSISDLITEKIAEYFPDISVQSVIVDKTEHTIQITLTYRISFLQENDTLILTTNV